MPKAPQQVNELFNTIIDKNFDLKAALNPFMQTNRVSK